MALTDYKITDSDISTYGVQSQPDKMPGTAAQNKAAFDKAGFEEITAENAYYFNKGKTE